MEFPRRSPSLLTRRITPSLRTSFALPRTLTSTSTHPTPQKSTEELTLELEREILYPERAETAQSGTDNIVGDDGISYDPSTTQPEIEFGVFEEWSRLQGGVDPLFISPANREFSQLLNPMAGGAVHNLDKLGPSSKGWTRKHREVRIRARVGEKEFDEYERLLRGLRKLQKRNEMMGGPNAGQKA